MLLDSDAVVIVPAIANKITHSAFLLLYGGNLGPMNNNKVSNTYTSAKVLLDIHMIYSKHSLYYMIYK